MLDFKIFYLRVCLMVFIHGEFSNAAQLDMPKRDTFFYTALIDKLYVKRPGDGDFTLHTSAKPMFLGYHAWSLSFYETDAARTYFSFSTKQVDLESFHSQAMAFSVREGNDLWHFRCIFAAHKTILDKFYSYLNASFDAGTTSRGGDIKGVQLYISKGPMQKPIARNLEDLRPASYYEDSVQEEGAPKRTAFSITPKSTRERIPRFVFRPNKFRVARLTDKVVLTLSGFEEWFYIFYFGASQEAVDFVNQITHYGTSSSTALEIPSDLLTYLRR